MVLHYFVSALITQSACLVIIHWTEGERLFLCNKVIPTMHPSQVWRCSREELAEMKKSQTEFLYLINFYTWLECSVLPSCHYIRRSQPLCSSQAWRGYRRRVSPWKCDKQSRQPYTNIYTCYWLILSHHWQLEVVVQGIFFPWILLQWEKQREMVEAEA